MISLARKYADALSWAVFIVAADCRTPIKAEGFEHGVHDATSDATEIERRLRLFPNANLALACGPRSGVIALDVDCKGAVDGFASLRRLEAEFVPLPLTWHSRTPSGGAHLLFEYPNGFAPRNRVGLKRWDSEGQRQDFPGLDVRGAGASIALPPSRKPRGAYVWQIAPLSIPLAPLPRWLLDIMLADPPEVAPAPPLRFDSADRAARYVAAAVDGECRELAAMAPNTGRNQRLFIASAKLGELVGGRLLGEDQATAALERAATESGLVREDGLHSVRATIRSGLQRGMQQPRELAAQQ